MLRGLLKHPALSDPEGTGIFEITDLFCSEIELFGAPYRFISGSGNNSIAKAHGLCQSILKATGSGLPQEYVLRAAELIAAVAELSEAVCARSGVLRTRSAMGEPPRLVTVPPTKTLREMKEWASFRLDELSADLLTTLEPLRQPSGTQFDVYPTYTDEVLASKPLLTTEDHLVVLAPGELAGALCVALQALAVDMDCVEELALSHERWVTSFVHHWLGFSNLEVDQPTHQPEIRATVINGDLQGQAVVVVIAGDRFDDYDVDEPFGLWASATALDVIEAELKIDGMNPPVVVYCAATTTRGQMTFVPAASEVLWLQMDPYDLISLMKTQWNDNTWGLVRFARATRRLERTTQVVSESVAALYGLYSANKDSFYLSDDQLPTALFMSGQDCLRPRLDERLRMDEHLVPTKAGSLLAISLSGTGYAPIYVLPDDAAPALAVELDDIFIWIRGRVDDPRFPLRVFLEGFAFWIWQLFALDSLRAGLREIRIELVIASGSSGNQIEVRRTGSVQFEFTVRPEVAFAAVPRANEFDRDIVRAIARDIAEPLGVISHEQIAPVVEQVAPPGDKKMFLVGSNNIPELHDSKIASLSRLIPQSVMSEVLDDLGDRLFSDDKYPPGDIPPELTVEVLNSAVATLFARLKSIVSQVDQEVALERLMRQAAGLEVAGRVEAIRRRTRIACYGAEHYPVTDLREQESRRIETSLAVRFLIEYVSATSPSGKAILNDDEHDLMCALALEITTKGMLSDARHYGLSDIECSRLASGRLGISREDRYSTGLITHSEAAIASSLSGQAAEDDESDWGFTPSEDAAFAAEFGFTADELQRGAAAIYNSFQEDDETVRRASRSAVVTAIAKETAWPESRADSFIELFELRRKEMFELNGDTAPWRFGKSRSYLRRPIVSAGEGVDEVLRWTPARLLSAVFDLVHLYQSGRLKARSKEMRSALGSVRQSHNNAFEKKVAEQYRLLGYRDVHERVTAWAGKSLTSDDGDNLGDIDVLVVDHGRRRVLVVEAKDFETARTPIEMSREMAKLRDEAVPKSHRRANWVRSNISLFSGNSGGRWIVEEVVVTSRPSTAAATGNAHETVVSLSDLR